MIRYILHDSIDKKRWDACIRAASVSHPCAESWYLDIVSPGWSALADDSYSAVFPLPEQSRAGIAYLMQPWFTQQLGLFSNNLPDVDSISEFIGAIPAKFRYTDIYLNSGCRMPETREIRNLTNYELHLKPEANQLTAGYHEQLRRNLRKAAGAGLRMSANVPVTEIISLFRSGRGKELSHIGDEQYRLIESIAERGSKLGQTETLGAFLPDGTLAAGILWVSNQQRSVFLFSGVSSEGRLSNAMAWLIDGFIREHAGEDRILDFEGSEQSGLARFYGSFGAEKVIYQRYSANRLPVPLRAGLSLWRAGRRWLQIK
jgi:hypothetical protein